MNKAKRYLLLCFFSLLLLAGRSVSAQQSYISVAGAETTATTTTTTSIPTLAQGQAPTQTPTQTPTTQPTLHDYIREGHSLSSPNTSQADTVSEFFQIHAIQPKLAASESETKPKIKTFLWHVLDNIGVPIPFYKGDDLDPSLKGSLPTISAESEFQNRSLSKQTTTIKNSVDSNSAFNRNKIPDSELDGVELPALRDLPSQSLGDDKNAVQSK